MHPASFGPLTGCVPQIMNEAERLALLHSLELLDTPSEEVYDSITRLAVKITGRPIGLIGLVDADRNWFKSKVGLDAIQTPREFAFCSYTIAGSSVFEVCDAEADPQFAHNPLVAGAPHVRYYAGVPIVVNDLPLGSLCVVDMVPYRLTQMQREALGELGHLANELIERRLINHTRRDFIASMSHEMRTPLNAVLGFAQLLGYERELGNSARGKVDRIIEAGNHLLALIDEALDMMRIDVGATQMAIADTDADTVIESVQELLEPLAQERRIRIDTVPSSVALRADARRLRQVLFNLAGNAIKYSNPDGRVTLGARRDGSFACIEVADDGPGLTKAQIDRLFKPFERLGRERDTIEGTGLGLALSRRLAEAMGGRIDVRSTPGQGTTFTVRLPLAGLARRSADSGHMPLNSPA